MIDFRPGNQGTIYWKLEHNGEGIANALVTLNVIGPDASVIVENGVPYQDTASGTGVYAYDLTGENLAQIGAYRVTWRSFSPATVEETIIITVGYESAYQFTRLDLRHRIARLVEGKDSFKLGQLTADPTEPAVSPALTTVMYDSTRMEATNSLRGWYFYLYTGEGAGEERRVSSNDGAGTFNITPTVPVYTPPDLPPGVEILVVDHIGLGDRYEIHRDFDTASYNQAISDAILRVSEFALVPVDYEGMSFSTSTYLYAIPAGFSHIYEVQVESTTGLWEDISPAAWNIMRPQRKLRFDPGVVDAFSGCAMRILGFRYPTDPQTDDSGIDVRPSYVINQAAAEVCQMGMGIDQRNYLSKYQVQQGLAEAERTRLRVAMPPNTRKVD